MAAFSWASNGVVVKSHGGTDAIGFASALDMAIDMAQAGIIARIVADRAASTRRRAGGGRFVIRSADHRLRRLSAGQHRHQ